MAGTVNVSLSGSDSPGSKSYDSEPCQEYRKPIDLSAGGNIRQIVQTLVARLGDGVCLMGRFDHVEDVGLQIAGQQFRSQGRLR